MDESPYQAPQKAPSPAQNSTRIGRGIALFCIVPCVLIMAFCQFPVGCAVLVNVTARSMDMTSAESAFAAIYLLHAATWSATAWAIWKNRSRAVIAALLAEVLALALFSLP